MDPCFNCEYKQHTILQSFQRVFLNNHKYFNMILVGDAVRAIDFVLIY